MRAKKHADQEHSRPTLGSEILYFFPTAPPAYDPVAFHLGQCEKHLRYAKLATSSEEYEADMIVPAMAVDFHRLITTEAAATLQTFLAEIINGTTNYKTVQSLTQQVEHQYHGRFLVELLQNAHDAMEDSCGRVSFSLMPNEGDYGCLYVVNDGHPFEHKNFQSLARLGQSSKDPNDSIGNKGIGFRSILEICVAPEIYSRARQTSDGFDGYCFRFSPAIIADLASALARLAAPASEARLELGDAMIPLRWTADDRAVFWERVTAKSEGWLAAELTFLSAYSIPLPINCATFVEKIRTFESQGYASVVRLPLKSGKARDLVVQALKTFSPGNLLFLERLDELTIELGLERRVFTRKSQSLGMPFDGQHITLSSKEGAFAYRVWSMDIGGDDDPEGVERLREAVRELPGKWPELSRARVTIAVIVGPAPALVQSDRDREVMGIPGQIGFSLPYVVDLINPERRSVTWNFDDASARYVALLIFNIIRPLPPRIMVAVSLTNVLPVRPISPRPKIP